MTEAEPRPGVRIGDAERDRAVASLGDHFAAGRLTRDELDERIDEAMHARFDGELAPLFADLPGPAPVTTTVAAAAPPRLAPRRPPAFAFAPLLLVAVVLTAVLAGAPWMLWGLVWFALASGFWSRAHRAHHASGPRMGPPHLTAR